MKSFVIKLTLCVLALAILPVSCFGKKNEPPPDPKFAAIDQIVLLPIVDARAGKKGSFDINSLRVATVDSLKRKNYKVIMIDMADNKGAPIETLVEDLYEQKPEWIKHLGPPEARWVMVIGIGELHGKNAALLSGGMGSGFGSAGIAEVFGFLFDKQDGSVLWKLRSSGEAGAGAAGIDALMYIGDKGTMEAAALDIAFSNLMSSIPKLPKKHK
jgi:hypothetical protein